MIKYKYKLVTIDDGKMYSCNIGAIMFNQNRSYKQSCEIIGEYVKKYEIGKVTKTIPGSLGIMVFEKLKNCERFIKQWTGRRLPHAIIRVETIGRGKSIGCISKHIKKVDIKKWYTFYFPLTKNVKGDAPIGTMGYPAVRPISIVKSVKRSL